MKKRRNNNKENNLYVRTLFLGILIIVIFLWMYLTFFSSGILLGPSNDGSVSYESARSFLTDLGEQGIEWYCGRSQSFIDLQGNVYQSKELEELKKILGNEIKLRNEFCR